MDSAGATQARVLLVEDDRTVVDTVRDGLAKSGIAVRHASSVAETLRLLMRSRFDALILDLHLPDGDGGWIADACRAEGRDVPIIMLTADDSVNDKVAGLSRGADDYLCKPFAVEELAARLRAVLRRARPARHHVLQYDDVQLDLLTRKLRRGELERALSAREVDLLAYFMCHPDELLPKERILQEVWGDEVEQDANILHVYANYLRNKLEGGLYPRILHTVRGVGYILSRHRPEDDPDFGTRWNDATGA